MNYTMQQLQELEIKDLKCGIWSDQGTLCITIKKIKEKNNSTLSKKLIKLLDSPLAVKIV